MKTSYHEYFLFCCEYGCVYSNVFSFLLFLSTYILPILFTLLCNIKYNYIMVFELLNVKEKMNYHLKRCHFFFWEGESMFLLHRQYMYHVG
jgi:hypothetical protein